MKKINPIARYFETNEWVLKNTNEYIIGITDFAQTVFGNINFIELPEVGQFFQQGTPFAVIESNKAANEVTMPVSGKIIAVNLNLLSNPDLLNQDPYGEGWLVKISIGASSTWDNLMTAKEYQAFIGVFFNKT